MKRKNGYKRNSNKQMEFHTEQQQQQQQKSPNQKKTLKIFLIIL